MLNAYGLIALREEPRSGEEVTTAMAHEAIKRMREIEARNDG